MLSADYCILKADHHLATFFCRDGAIRRAAIHSNLEKTHAVDDHEDFARSSFGISAVHVCHFRFADLDLEHRRIRTKQLRNILGSEIRNEVAELVDFDHASLEHAIRRLWFRRSKTNEVLDLVPKARRIDSLTQVSGNCSEHVAPVKSLTYRLQKVMLGRDM